MEPCRICAWCLAGPIPTLTVLDGTPVEIALLAVAESVFSHGICKPCRKKVWAEFLG